jgi:endonuclease/exonuclease/phosphatase family metal-dependent hydrolase
MTHQSFAGSPGTYGTCASIKQKIDYILLSPALWAKVLSVGTERRGIYAPRAGKPFETVTSAETSASDHAAVWVDLEI